MGRANRPASARSVFVSHAHVDNDLCERYVRAMDEQGIDYWYDRANMQGGLFLGEEIQRELLARHAFVLMMTRSSLTSFWVRLEMFAYFSLMSSDPSRIFMPIKIRPCEVPPVIAAFPWLDGTQLSEWAVANKLVELLGASSAEPGGGMTQLKALHSSPALSLSLPVAPLSPNRRAEASPLPPALVQLGYTWEQSPTGGHILPPLCEVPAGAFFMGSVKDRDADTWDDELNGGMTKVEAYRIARFPVTVAEYSHALDAKAKGVRQPKDWMEQQTKPEHPVVSVSWDDAVHYCAWLSAQSGRHWRLPTEAEWEKAARWDELVQQSRRYPWGEEWRPDHANTSDSGRRGTTAIDAFSIGTSPYGVVDMIGNAWEWTSSLGSPYPYIPTDGREDPHESDRRVARGSSWYENKESAYAAYRKMSMPTERLSTLGFRLARSFPHDDDNSME